VSQPSDKHPAARPSLHWPHILRALVLAITLAASFGLPATARAQGTAAPGAAPITSGEVKIELESFGLGNVARVGDWTGIRLKITDTGSKSRDLIIRIAGLDFDGDTPLYQRVIASNPGSPMSVWMYVRLPFSFNQTSGLPVYAYEASEETGEGADDASGGRRAGRLLGFTELRSTGTVREAPQALIAVVGPQAPPLGLNAYSLTSGGSPLSRGVNPAAHEVTDIVQQLNPAALPDRWTGLESFDAVVWAQGDPVQLDEPRSNALREYVLHGGHLVIILPSVNQTWTDERSNKLLDVMPAVSLAQKDVEDFDRYRPLLARQPLPGATPPTQAFPRRMPVYTFTPRQGAEVGEAVRVLNGPDGDCVVVRRLVGSGAITLVGLDLNNQSLWKPGYIDADMFWHRVLGRRGDYSPRPQQGGGIFGGQRKIWMLDEGIAGEIAKQGDAAAGVLVGFVVFLLYWLVAAPVGFFLLKRFNKTQHAWVAFVATTAVFTVISWTGAKFLRDSTVGASHLTVLDHVYGQPYQRAKMWSSVSIPRYGTATISVGEQDTGDAPPINNLIASWDTPADTAWGGFPDVRGYVVDTRSPDTIRVPVRSTVKQVEVVWAGGPQWQMPRPMRPEEGGTGTLRLQDRGIDASGMPTASAVGKIVHSMPGPLEEGLLVIVRRQRNIARFSSDWPVCVGEVFKINYAWQPGSPLDLDLLTKSVLPKDSDLRAVTNTMFRVGEGGGAATDMDRRFAALAFFNQLPPNEPGLENAAAQRTSTHGWDLGHWFTQPCIMIIGRVGSDRAGVASPVPLMVDGEAVPNTGQTMVRWIYPLPDDPPPFPQSSDAPTAPVNDAPAVEGGEG